MSRLDNNSTSARDDISDMNNIFQKRKNFTKFIENSGFLHSEAITNLKYSSLIFIFMIIAYSLFNHFFIAD